MQRFKSKRRVKKRAIWRLIIIILLIFVLLKNIGKIIRFFPNQKFLNILISDKEYSFGRTEDNAFILLYNYLTTNLFNKPNNLILNTLNFDDNKKDNAIQIASSEIKVDNNREKSIKRDNNDSKPLVYIYSSHQKEDYSHEYTEDYNVSADVFLASKIIKQKLEEININTMVMEDNITKYLEDNNLDYSYSYYASRHYLKDIVNNYNSIKLFIDLHRDAANKNATTTEINGISCARVMFVIGKEYDTYLENLKVSKDINEKINQKYPNLSRGIIEKSGYGVNGVYNQDLKNNIILIELGGNENNFYEVLNTIDLIVPIIGEYINE